MKLTIDIKTLLAALNRAKPVATGRAASALPALSCFLLTATDKLTVAANNLDLFISTDAAANVSEPGSVCVSARRLSDVIAALGSGEVEIEADTRNFVAIRRGASLIRLMGLSPAEFPESSHFAAAESITLPASDLQRMLCELGPFASDEAARYILCAVAFQSKKGQLNLITTNGRCLRLATPSIDAPEMDLIVPNEACALLSRVLESGDAVLSWSESALRVSAPGFHVITKQVEGNYPNWQQVVPEEGKISAIAPRAAWLDAINIARTTSLVNKDNDPSIKLVVTKKGVTLETNCPDAGSASIPVDGATANGELSIALQVSYLRNGIESFAGEETRLNFSDHMAPVTIQDATGLFVVMPMRIS